jgi:hypothetical protein
MTSFQKQIQSSLLPNSPSLYPKISISTKVVASQAFVSIKDLTTYLFISFPFDNTGGSTLAMNKIMKVLEHIHTSTLILLKYLKLSTDLPCANSLFKEF